MLIKINSQQRKFLFILPLIALPFFCLVFTSLKGGTAGAKDQKTAGKGINPELPKANFDHTKTLQNKLSIYEEANQDSVRKKDIERQDPYHSGKLPALATDSMTVKQLSTAIVADPKVERLLDQLEQLRRSVREPGLPPDALRSLPARQGKEAVSVPAAHTNRPEDDPQINQLNTMLDKVIKIQHPAEPPTVNTAAEEVQPADSSANTILAVVPDNQTVSSGATIVLRLSEDILVNQQRIAKGQLVYGIVSISNDRMLMQNHSILQGRNLYTADLQVLDLDGLPGIRIPGLISRDVAKTSADQGINGLNLATLDPSIGAQAANAGVQTAKSLLSHKVRLIRVSVRAGYQVLLRNNKVTGKIASPKMSFDSSRHNPPPGIVPGGAFLQRSRIEGMELGLAEICLKDSLLWFGLAIQNHSPIDYVPDYARWFIRDRHQFRRTAAQEWPLEAASVPQLSIISGDSSCYSWTGFRPFALAKDKELVVEIGEKNSGRVLTLIIDHNKILKARR